MYSEMLPGALSHTPALWGLHWYTDTQLMLILQLWMSSKSQVNPAVRDKVEMAGWGGFENAGEWKYSRIHPFLRERTLGVQKLHKMTPAQTFYSVFVGSRSREEKPKNLFHMSHMD